MNINFGEWLPDQPSVIGALSEANNVYAVANGYAPIPSAVSLGTPTADALTNTFTGKYGSAVSLFASSATKIYKYNIATLAYDNVSKAGNYTTTVIDYAQFGSVLITSNGFAKLQGYSLTTPALFYDISAAAPAAKYVTVVRDFVVAANTTGFENKVFWSDINDETNWTPSATSQSDTQVIADGGNIQGITGGEFGLILMEKAIHRMTYTGAPLFFQFDNISRGLGCVEPASIAQHKNITYFLSDDGFYQCDGQTVTGIGNEKVDRYFFNNISPADFNTMSAVADPIKKLIIWNYKSGSGSYAQLIYNWVLNKWSSSNLNISHISELASATITLESLNAYGTVDTITISFDSRFWSSSKLLLSGINGNNVVTLDGANSAASISTGDLGIDGYRSVITMARPIVNNGSASVSIASRKTLDANIAFTTPTPANTDGRSPQRTSGRYHRVKVQPTGAWTYAVGVDLDIAPQGTR